MPSIAVVLDPAQLDHPDADLRYVLPDLVAARSTGTVSADGYDYLDDDRMIVFLRAADLARATAIVLDVLATERPLGNVLGSAVVGVRESDDGDGPYRIVHPPDHPGDLLLP